MESLQRDIERLKHEVGALTSMGTIECAIRNPAVSESMRHWEGRAESAEREVAALRAMLVDARLDNSRLRGSR
jgi:tRNA C32,U32 (ribose-2'-O)-methylase TrmJ